MSISSAVPPLPLVPVGAPAAPPHPLDGQWYMLSGQETFGPFTGHQMRDFAGDGRLSAGTDIVRVGNDTWQKASQDLVLGAFFQPPAAHAPHLLPNGSSGPVSAAAGATIVQVTNNLAPAPQADRRFLIEDGEAKRKSAGLAFVLSVLCVGLGQLYNGQIGKGILMFFLCVAAWFILLGWVIMLWSWIDAYRTAKAMNARYERRLTLGLIV